MKLDLYLYSSHSAPDFTAAASIKHIEEISENRLLAGHPFRTTSFFSGSIVNLDSYETNNQRPEPTEMAADYCLVLGLQATL